MSDEQQTTQVAEESKPSTQQQPPEPISFSKIKENIRSAPSRANEAIQSGKGNSLIAKAQDALSALIYSIPNSCRFLTLNQLLLTDKEKDKVTRNCMLIGSVCALVIFGIGLFTGNTARMLLAAMFIVAIIVSNGFVSKKGIDTNNKTRPKPKAKHSKPKPTTTTKTKTVQDDEDIFL